MRLFVFIFVLVLSGLGRIQGSFTRDAAALRELNYTINLVNEIDSRTNEDAIEVIGVAHPEATVKVNGDAGTYRRGEYFRKEVAVANNSYPTISVTAEHGGVTGTPKTGEIFIPPATESYLYDDDGNVLEDGRWQYTWDGENQLVAMESLSLAPSGSQRKLEFDYDHLGRRIAKRVYVDGEATPSTNLKFIYDGWNLIAELKETDNSLVRGYIWGSDLSGSLQGAGGTGGLVAVVTSTEAHFAVMDGSGNVVGLVDASSGLRSATYEYDPFGQIIRKTGSAADLNPFRFSTRYADVESGMVYYGYRYYSPSIGRWLNPDPIGELGGVNLYAFVGNDPANYVDVLGLFVLDEDGFPIEESYNGLGAYLYDAETRCEHDKTMSEGKETAKKAAATSLQIVTTLTPIPGDEVAVAAILGGAALKGTKAGRALGKIAELGKRGINKVKSWWKGKPAIKTTRELLDDLPKGRQSHVRTIKTELELKTFHDKLTAGGTPIPPGTYPGSVTKLSDGTIVRMRPASKSGGSTVDITHPDGKLSKVHIE